MDPLQVTLRYVKVKHMGPLDVYMSISIIFLLFKFYGTFNIFGSTVDVQVPACYGKHRTDLHHNQVQVRDCLLNIT